MNRSASDLGLAVLVVSQFTLYADTTRAGGRRSSGLLLRNWPGAWSIGSWTG